MAERVVGVGLMIKESNKVESNGCHLQVLRCISQSFPVLEMMMMWTHTPMTGFGLDDLVARPEKAERPGLY